MSEIKTTLNQVNSEWTPSQKIAFRIAFIFYFILSVPTSWDWVERIFKIDFSDINYRDLYDVAGYSPNFIRIESESGRWGIASYSTWGIILLVAIIGAIIWTAIVRVRKTERKEYNILYYWLRVFVRYRIAVGIIAFGYVKLFPTQMPFPSQAVLNTEFGDFLEQKVYWYSVGITIWYQVFLGFIEVFGGALLFYRRTSALGAALVAIVLFNIAFANHSYDGGVHVYAGYFVVLSLFILAYDFPRIWNLLVNRKDITPVHYAPSFSKTWQKYTRLAIKYSIILIFLPFFFYIRYANYFIEVEPIKKEPTRPGLSGAKGEYQVTEFRLNNQVLPYSPLDSVRWQSATFEKWSTFTFKVNKPVKIDLGNGGPAKKDIDKNFELSGIAGGRRFFYYDADTVKRSLYLVDKIIPTENARNASNRAGFQQQENARKQKLREKKKLEWHYERPSADRVIITGLNENKDSIYVVLDKINKKYPLVEKRGSQKEF